MLKVRKSTFAIGGAVLVIATAVFLLVRTLNPGIPEGIEIAPVSRADVIEEVSETGFVASAKEVALAFERGGRVTEIPAEIGATFAEGDVLIRLDDAQQAADVNAAYARLEAEQIRLSELLRGADAASLAVTQSSVAGAQTAVTNAELNLAEVTAQHDQLVENARKTLRSSDLEAYLISNERSGSDASFEAPTITGTYNHEEEGVYTVELYSSSAASGYSMRISGLESDTQSVSTVNPIAIGTRGLYIQFPDDFAGSTKWEIPVPNTRSSSYLSNLNTYNAVTEARNVAITTAQNALNAAKSGLQQANSQYNQVSQSARDERVAAQEALVRAMSASVESARVAYENMTLRAPFAGIVTSLSAEVGQMISPQSPVVSLISDGNFEITVYISESDIQEIGKDDTAEVTLDAYDDTLFQAKVTRIAPSAEIVDGVRVFEVTLQFSEENPLIRSGLSADIDLRAASKEDVLAVPSRAIIENEDGRFVRRLNNNALELVPVTTGLRGSNGLTEITKGLQEGEMIITFADNDALEALK